MTVATSSTLRVRKTDHTDRLSQQPLLMTLHASPRIRVKTNLTHPVAKAQKGFLSRLFSCSPQVSVKTVVRRPSAPEVLSHTDREPPGQNLSQRQPAPPISTQDPPESEVSINASSPRCKSIKDNLHELGLTTPVVLTQPQVAGSEAVLPRVDKAVSLQDMLLSGVRSELCKTSRTSSSQSTPGSSRGQVHTTSDYALNSERPVLDITHDDGRFAHLATSTSSLPGSSPDQASRMAVVEKFEEVALPTHKKIPSSVRNDRIPSSKIPPIPSSTSTPSNPSTHSMHNHAPPPNCSKGQRRSPSVDSGQMSVTSVHSQRYVPPESASLFPVDEGLFGRPKPPPPLKIIPKKTKKKKDAVPVSLLPTTRSHEHLPTRTSHTRSQTVHQTPVLGYFNISDRSNSAPEPPTPAPAPVHVQASKGRSLSRTSTLMTVASDQTQASATSAPELPQNSKWTWTPPADWSGPSSTKSSESEDSTPSTKKPVFLAHLRRAKSSPRLIVSAAKLLSSYPETSSTTPAHSAMTKLGDKEHVSPTPKKRDSHGVIVKMQGFRGDGLKETPLHDVIPRLRELKCSAL